MRNRILLAMLGVLFIAMGQFAIANAYAATVTLSNGASCVAASVAVTCASSAPPPVESCSQRVTRLYLEVLKRAPDGGGLEFWAGRCEAGMTEAELRAALTASIPVAPPAPPVGVSAAIVPDWPQGEVLGRAPPFNIHASGTVHAYRVQRSQIGRASSSFSQGQTPNTGAQLVTEMQVSRTPGVIDESKTKYRTTFYNFVSITIYDRDPPQYLGEGEFYAPSSEGASYVNVRWTTPTGQSGSSMIWGEGPR